MRMLLALAMVACAASAFAEPIRIGDSSPDTRVVVVDGPDSLPSDGRDSDTVRVPEPATGALLAAGIAALGLRFRKQSR